MRYLASDGDLDDLPEPLRGGALVVF